MFHQCQFCISCNIVQGAVRVMAKDLVRTRHQVEKFYKLKSQLQGVSLRIQVCDCIYCFIFCSSIYDYIGLTT